MPLPVPGRVVEALRRSTVQIHLEPQAQTRSGSGIIVRPELVLVTAAGIPLHDPDDLQIALDRSSEVLALEFLRGDLSSVRHVNVRLEQKQSTCV